MSFELHAEHLKTNLFHSICNKNVIILDQSNGWEMDELYTNIAYDKGSLSEKN